jgi:hypothetical protein
MSTHTHERIDFACPACGFKVAGGWLARCLEISRALLGVKCWGKNADRTPRHPLMLPYSTQLEPL